MSLTVAQNAQLATLEPAVRAGVIAHYSANEKSSATFALLALFLGGIGIHHFYMGRTLAGVLSVLFFWTFLPAVFALIELICTAWIVGGHNKQAFNMAMAANGVLPAGVTA